MSHEQLILCLLPVGKLVTQSLQFHYLLVERVDLAVEDSDAFKHGEKTSEPGQLSLVLFEIDEAGNITVAILTHKLYLFETLNDLANLAYFDLLSCIQSSEAGNSRVHLILHLLYERRQ